MFGYYIRLLRELPGLLLDATDRAGNIVAFVALTVLAVVIFISQPVTAELSKRLNSPWLGVDPMWALAPIVLAALWGLLKLNYQHLRDAEGERDRSAAQLRRLAEPRLRIVFRPEAPFQYVARTHNPAGTPTEQERVFSVGIENLCATSIDGVLVQMVHMKGRTRDGREVNDPNPFTLQLDDTGTARNRLLEPFTVNPGESGMKRVHVVRKSSRDPSAELNFLGAARPNLPPGDYVFTIKVEGRDVRAVEGPSEFRVGIGDDQELTFEPLRSS